MHETRQIAEGIVILHQSNLTPYQAFLARPSGSFTALPLLRYIGSKGGLHSFTNMPCIESAVIALKHAA